MIRNATTEDMKTLTVCLNKLMSEGYNIDFKVAEKGEELTALQTEKNYRPGEIHVVNFYRFEGASDPADNSILYAIETNDGAKGTLVDAFGPYADRKVEDFMKAVEDISKKNAGDVTPEMINGV
ncbi:MAG: phosphoribosylpyrophosphate synthetase [Sphingobacteriales bacterium]|nr:phosphoribosylpyrophosphate synthetase [Sphingobacteriales bacterium]